MLSGREVERYAIKFCFKLGRNAMRWKLYLLLWHRDQKTEFPVEACWLSQTQEGKTEKIHPQTFDDPFFWQHWHDLDALGSHWTDSQQGILRRGFKGVQEEIPSEEASTHQIESVTFSSNVKITLIFLDLNFVDIKWYWFSMHQSITPSLSQTIWVRWASRKFLTLPIVWT